MMGQQTGTAGGAAAGDRSGSEPTSAAPPMTPPGGHRPVTGGFPAGPRAPYAQRPGPAPYAWAPADDVDDPRAAGNAPAAFSVILGLLALLISLRPLAFGSMIMAWDTYLALGIAVVTLVLGGAALRTPVRRPLAVVGMTISVLSLLVVAALPTI